MSEALNAARRWAQWHLALLMVCLMAPAWGWSQALIGTTRLDPEATGPQRLTPYLSLIDGTGQIDFPAARQLAERGEGFTRQDLPLQTRLDSRPRWFVLEFESIAPRPTDWVLHLGSVCLHEIAFFGPLAEGAALPDPVPNGRSGLSLPWAERAVRTEEAAYPFRLEQPGRYRIYVRASAQMPQNYSFLVQQREPYLLDGQDKRFLYGLGYGLLIGVLLYNLMLYFAFRDRAYLHYVLTCLGALATLSVLNGYALRFVPVSPHNLRELLFVLAPASWILFTGLFGQSFLQLAQRAPALNRVAIFIEVLTLPICLLAIAGWIDVAQACVDALAGLGSVFLFGSGLWLWRKGFTPASWYVAGLTLLFSWVIVYVLFDLGLLMLDRQPLFYLQWGVVTESFIFSYALGRRVKAVRASAQTLEVQAQALKVAASTDPLTGLANREGLNEYWQKLQDQRQSAAVMVIDLDKFKPINDTHGHEAGDQVLVAVAERLRHWARSTDLVARTGGDEFVAILPAMTHRDLPDRMTTLSRRLSEAIQHGDLTLHISASIGSAFTPDDGVQLTDVMHAADQAMYAQKRGAKSQAAASRF